MGNIFCFGWEEKLIIFIQQYMPQFMVKFAALITEFGDAMVLVGVVGMFYWALNKELGKKLVINLTLINIVNPWLKCIVRRLRPYMANSEIQCLNPVNTEGDIYDVVSQDFSFPSGHAANCVSVYGKLCKNSRSKVWKFVLILLTLLVGISRFALGVHYPTDVIVGWLIAAICLVLYSRIERKLGRNKTYLLLALIGLAGFFFARTNDFFTGYGMMVGAVLAILFEEKYVRFEGTKKPLRVIIRTVVGAGLYLGLNELLKLPFTAEFLNSGTLPAFIVRAARYALIAFLLLGVYPVSFSWKDSVLKKKRAC